MKKLAIILIVALFVLVGGKLVYDKVSDKIIVTQYCNYKNETLVSYEGERRLCGDYTYNYITRDNRTGVTYIADTNQDYAKYIAKKHIKETFEELVTIR